MGVSQKQERLRSEPCPFLQGPAGPRSLKQHLLVTPPHSHQQLRDTAPSRRKLSALTLRRWWVFGVVPEPRQHGQQGVRGGWPTKQVHPALSMNHVPKAPGGFREKGPPFPRPGISSQGSSCWGGSGRGQTTCPASGREVKRKALGTQVPRRARGIVPWSRCWSEVREGSLGARRARGKAT